LRFSSDTRAWPAIALLLVGCVSESRPVSDPSASAPGAEPPQCRTIAAYSIPEGVPTAPVRVVLLADFSQYFDVEGACLLIDGRKAAGWSFDPNAHVRSRTFERQLAAVPVGKHKFAVMLRLRGAPGLPGREYLPGYVFDVHSAHDLELEKSGAAVRASAGEVGGVNPSSVVPLEQRPVIDWAVQSAEDGAARKAPAADGRP
jgi:hypothetical protein